MRKAFIETLIELAEADPRVMLLTADLGFSVLEPFAERFPGRFINVGVAEQNMLGLATGLAKEGFVPFVYSMGTFATMRPLEFIRNGPILHHLMVRIIGVGGGFDYGTAGFTHHSLEDVGVLRALSGIRIYSPADARQLRAILKTTSFLEGPIYYRLNKENAGDIPELAGRFDLDQVQEIKSGGDMALFSAGTIVREALAAANDLEKNHHIHCAVFVVPSLHSNSNKNLQEALAHRRSAVTIETHNINGGLGSLVAEVIADNQLSCPLLRLGVKAGAPADVGDASFLNARNGLSKDGIVAAAAQFYGNIKK